MKEPIREIAGLWTGDFPDGHQYERAERMAAVSRYSFEQLVSARTAEDPQISPDGRSVIFVTGYASKEGEHAHGDLWIWREGDDAPAPLTSGPFRDDSVDWSPDGKYIVFSSDRAEPGKRQIYLLAVDGGEAVRLTDHDGGASDPLWSPDGTRIAYLVRDPESEEEKRRKDERDDANVVDENVRRNQIWIIDLPEGPDGARRGAPGEPQRLLSEDLHICGLWKGAFNWFPDGSGFVAVTAEGPKVDYQWFPELVTITLEGAIKRFGTFPGLFLRPEVSPDSSTIAFIASGSVAPMSIGVVHVVPAAGGEAQALAATSHGSAGDLTWMPDGKHLLVNLTTGLRAEVCQVSTDRSAIAPVFPDMDRDRGSVIAGPSRNSDGSRVAFVRSEVDGGPNVWIGTPGEAPVQITDLNPWTAEAPTGDMIEIEWSSTDGGRVQGLVVLPVGYVEGERYPTLVHIHGGPMGAWTTRFYASWHDWGQVMAQRGYAVLLPNPRGSSGRGPDYLAGNVNDLGGLEWDDINTGVDELIRMGIADEEQLVIGGWSYGGFFTNWAITHTNRFKAAVSGAGISNWVSFAGTTDIRRIFDAYFPTTSDEDASGQWASSPIRYMRHARTPTLILHGEDDVRVPLSQSEELYAGLKDRGVTTQLVTYPREPHTLGERKHQLDMLKRVTAWYDKHLGRVPENEQHT